MIEVKEFEKLMQGVGNLPCELELFLVESYGEGADLHYQRARYSMALARFVAAFPDIKRVSIARAPARLDLIGEHTDYNGLPVLSMAIERDVVVLYSPRKDRRVNVINTSFWYPAKSFEIARRIRPYSEGNWGNYVKLAADVVRSAAVGDIKGFDGCVFGDIPSQSGLGSSTALVTACAMAILGANHIATEPRDLAARISARDGSTAIATAAATLAEPGKTLKIESLPPSTLAIALPREYSFVVCNSLMETASNVAKVEACECRVAECRLAVAVLTMTVGQKLGPNRGLTLLGGLRRLSAKQQREAIETLPDGPAPLREVAKLVGMPASRLREAALGTKSGECVREPRDGFRLKDRARHVISEGRRVDQAATAVSEGDMESFGKLMNESHESSSRDYEISTPEMDLLAGICRAEGALGAKLTGGGFGGCVVALVRDRDIPDFESAIISRYYHDYLQKERNGSPISVVALEDAIFPCKPCGGARGYA